MNRISIVFSLAVSMTLFSCGDSSHSSNAYEKTITVNTEVVINEEKEALPTATIDSLITTIDAIRASIEANLGEPMIVETKELREKLKQKWTKVHYYTADGQVVRIKTYPHESISNRTEEFYLDGQNLVLAVIEDDGTGDRGKTGEAINKMYYFHDGKVIEEMHSVEESEYTLRDSDAEELLAEVKEYLDIYSDQSGK